MLFEDTYWADLHLIIADLTQDCNQACCAEHTTEVKHLATIMKKECFSWLTGEHTDKQTEYSNITVSVAALSLRASAFIHYCVHGFSTLLKCCISCKDSELASVRVNGIFLRACCSREGLDL